MRLRLVFALSLPLAAALLPDCGKPAPSPAAPDERDRVIHVDGADAEMNAAMDRARREVDAAIQKLQAGAKDFSVKVPITDQGQTEYFWLSHITYQDGSFHGRIDNEPEDVHTVKLGDERTVPKDGIADWMYMEDGKMYGNYTLRVLLKKMPEAEAAQYRRILAD